MKITVIMIVFKKIKKLLKSINMDCTFGPSDKIISLTEGLTGGEICEAFRTYLGRTIRFGYYFDDFIKDYEIVSLDTESLVSETPMSNEEGIEGCFNRINDGRSWFIISSNRITFFWIYYFFFLYF